MDFTRADSQVIKFTNKHNQPVIVQVILEQEQKPLSAGVDDTQLALAVGKMETLLDSMKQTEMKRQNRYKWEWGFMDKELKHQEEMLALTGVELFIIIATAIVQMYCIKNLLDNSSVV